MALQFDGSSDYFYNGTSFMDLSSDIFAMGAWVYIDSAVDNVEYCVMNMSTTSTARAHDYRLSLVKTGPLSVSYQVKLIITSRFSAVTVTGMHSGPFVGKWAHICANNKSKTNHRVYINGVDAANSSTSIDPTITGTRWCIGARKYQSIVNKHFPGRICEAFVYDDSLQDFDIGAIGKNPVSPLLHSRITGAGYALVNYVPMVRNMQEPIKATAYTAGGATTPISHARITYAA